MIHPIILSGGSSARLWPLSQTSMPKQFLALTSERTMLQETARRFLGQPDFAAPSVICHEDHRFIVAEQLRLIDCVPNSIVLEPAGRNTAPAATLAALKVVDADPNGIVLILPADHLITDLPALRNAVSAAVAAAKSGRLVALGIAPDRPHTGYGYIRIGEPMPQLDGCHAIDRFVEKPDGATARAFLETGGYLWNGGMFAMRADRLVEEMQNWAPDVLEACQAALGLSESDADFLRPNRDAFERCPSISIDHAVMEHTSAGAVVPVDMGWHDIGTWTALWEVMERSADGNAICGPVTALETSDCYLRSEGPDLAVIGLKDHIVVATGDAVLVCPKDHAEDVRVVAKGKAVG